MLERAFRARRAMASDGLKETLGMKRWKRPMAHKLVEAIPAPKAQSVSLSVTPKRPIHLKLPRPRVPASDHSERQESTRPVTDDVPLSRPLVQAQNWPPRDRTIPQGMRLLSEVERRSMLEVFGGQRERLRERLSRFPLRINDPALLRHKFEIQTDLDEVELFIEQINRRYVFMQA